MSGFDRYCGLCGSGLPQKAKFCGHCGAAQMEWDELLRETGVTKAARKRSFRFSSRLFQGLVLVILTAAVVGWLKGRSSTNRSMPSQTVTHPEGVRVWIPENTLAGGAEVKIRLLKEGPPVEPFRPLGAFVSIEAATLELPQRASEVALPLEGSAQHATVLVESVGRWMALPAREEHLDGRRVLKVKIGQMPFPWNFVVVDSPHAPRLADGSQPGAKLTRLEQLCWSDFDRFLKEIASYPTSDALTQRVGFELIPSAHAAPAGAALVRDELNKARFQFLKTRASLKQDGAETALGHYKEGLEHLSLAKDALRGLGQAALKEELEDWCDSEQDAFFGGGWTLEELVQQHCGAFAPWGLEFTRGILAGRDAAHRGFDVRVVPEFGQLLAVNMMLPGSGRPMPLESADRQAMPVVESAQLEAVNDLKLVPEECKVFQTVQIFSPRLYERDFSEWLIFIKNGKTYYEALVGVAVLVKGAPAGAMAMAFYAVAAPVVESLLLDPVAKDFGTQHPALEVGVYQAYEGAKLSAAMLLTPKKVGVSNLTETVLNSIIDFERVHWLEDLRSRNFGALPYKDNSPWLSRYGFRVPPILLSSNVYGPRRRAAPWPFGRYRVGGWITLKFVLNYNALANSRLAGYNLAAAFEKRLPELRYPIDSNFQANTVYGTHWRALGGDSTQKRLLDQAPDLQVVFFSIKKKQVEEWAKQHGMSLEKFLSKAVLKGSLGAKYSTQPLLQIFSPSSRPSSLESLLRPQQDKELVQFWMAMSPRKFFGDPSPARHMEMSEANVGVYEGVPVHIYETEAAKRFTFRIMLDKTVIFEFPVGFGEMVVSEPSRLSVNPSSKLLMEQVYLRPEAEPQKPGRLVWIKDPISQQQYRSITRRYGDFPKAWEVEISFIDGRPPVVRRMDYNVLRPARMEFEDIEVAKIHQVLQKIYNKDTGKYVPNLYLESGNPIWDTLMSGQVIALKSVEIKLTKDSRGMDVLSIHDRFGESPSRPKPKTTGGGIPVGAPPIPKVKKR